MWWDGRNADRQDRDSNPGSLNHKSGALPTELSGADIEPTDCHTDYTLPKCFCRKLYFKLYGFYCSYIITSDQKILIYKNEK